ncbi:hypothetical protein PS834_02199 [Pseudomonas fluorescens]|nr:hypothetical protein PS834_02199 [Pseudomonas fluorescens]
MSWPAGLLWQSNFSRPADFLWRAGLPRAGLRSSPTPTTVDISGTPRQQGLGRLRHPARGKPARHRDGGHQVRIFWRLRSRRQQHHRSFVARRLLVASGLAPRWAAQQPHSNHRRYFRHTAPAGFGAASPPSAGQARSPQGWGAPGQDFLETSQPEAAAPQVFCSPQTSCGERACPALGCAAAPLQPP